MNRNKQRGDKLPMFINGRISKPGNTEEFPMSVWSFEYKNADGQILTGFSGQIGEVPNGAEAAAQVEALMRANPNAKPLEAGNLTVQPNQFICFANPRHGQNDGKDHNTHYGFANFGDGSPIVQIGVWLGKDRYERAMLQGSTQYPKTREEVEAAKSAAGPLSDLTQPRAKVDAEKKPRSRSEGRDR